MVDGDGGSKLWYGTRYAQQLAVGLTGWAGCIAPRKDILDAQLATRLARTTY